MEKLKIYIESTLFNTFFDDESTERRFYTHKLFKQIEEGKFEAFFSDLVIEELRNTEEPKKIHMLSLLSEYKMQKLKSNSDIVRLADLYVKEDVVLQGRRLDALHIALVSFYGLDVLVSYNCRQIVRVKSFLLANTVNKREGYKDIILNTPEEVIDYDD